MTETEFRELLDELITAAGEEHIAFEQGLPGVQHTREVENAKAFIVAAFRKTYAENLEWAAKWIEGSVGESATAEVREFAHNMAMSIRARIIQGW